MMTSHTATFSLPRPLHTAFQATPVSVEINGEPANDLQPLSIIRQTKAPLHLATLRLIHTPQHNDRRRLSVGTDIRILWKQYAHSHIAQPIAWPVFDGCIQSITRDMDADQDTLIIRVWDRISYHNQQIIHDAI